MQEEWRPVAEFEGLYEVSSWGRIKMVAAGYRKMPGTIIKTPCDGRYIRCNLWRDGKCYSRSVHRLVAIAFLGDPLPSQQVNHIDGNKLNNRLENLEWTTAEENQSHAVRTGLRLSGELHVYAKLTAEDVRTIRNELAQGANGAELARRFNTTKENINSIKHKKSWKYLAA